MVNNPYFTHILNTGSVICKLYFREAEMSNINLIDEGSRSEVARKKRNLIQLAKIIIYFCDHASEKLYKTKLQKLLFYTQFLYYKTFSKRLLDDNFIRDYYGPVMDNLDEHLELLESVSYIKTEDTGYGTVINAKIRIRENEYTPEEIIIMRKVHARFDKFTAKQISDYSHNETLWKDTSFKEVISIERAYELHDI
jgi:uncharacterized phage-associated protein